MICFCGRGGAAKPATYQIVTVGKIYTKHILIRCAAPKSLKYIELMHLACNLLDKMISKLNSLYKGLT